MHVLANLFLVQVSREIVLALLEFTHTEIDCACDCTEAVGLFSAAHTSGIVISPLRRIIQWATRQCRHEASFDHRLCQSFFYSGQVSQEYTPFIKMRFPLPENKSHSPDDTV